MTINRVGSKLSLLTCLLLLGVIATFSNLTLQTIRREFFDAMTLRASYFARFIKEGMVPKVDPFYLHLQVHQMLEEKGVSYSAVMDTQGVFLSHSDSKLIGEKDRSDAGANAVAADKLLLQTDKKGDTDVFDISVPITYVDNNKTNVRVGTARIGFTSDSLQAALHEPLNRILFISGLALGIAVLGTILLVAWMMRPLPVLAQAAEQVGQGALDVEIPQYKSRDEIGSLARSFKSMLKGLMERERIRSTFGKFVSPEIAEMAMKGQMALGGQKRDVTILLVDIRNFTRFSEQLPPEEIVTFLNDYFSQMVQVVIDHKGNVDKFIGDAILAVFGAPNPLSDHAVKAAGCALALKERLSLINAERQKKGVDPVKIGIAINSGQVVAGTLGSKDRMEYTVIGDTVNLTSRLEGVNEKLGTDALVTQNTYSLIQTHVADGQGFSFKSWGLTKVRGRVEPVMVYELLGYGKAPNVTSPIVEERRKIYQEQEGVAETDSGITSQTRKMNVSGSFAPVMGQYEIEREIAKGGMGVVYLGHNPKTNIKAAIKTMKFGEELTPEEAKDVRVRFFQEAEAAGHLSHPSIVKIYEVGEEQNVPYIAMEYLEGNDLSPYCDKNALLAPSVAAEVVARIADALDYSHKQGVVHRDIKPSNVMVVKDKSLRIMDFGIARIAAKSRTATGTVLGTPSYMSPEQVSGKKVDGRSDIFSLGVVLFEMLTGEKPFNGDGENIGTLLFQIALDPHPNLRTLNPKIPKELVDVVDRALKKKIEERFATAGEMAAALRKCFQGGPGGKDAS